MNESHYINLTNGLEFISILKKRGIDFKTIRIPSTVLEQNDWHELLNRVSDDMLFDLAIGRNVFFYDCGCRRTYSKTVFFAIPVINYIINRLWFNYDNDDKSDVTFSKRRITTSPTIDQLRAIFNQCFKYQKNSDVYQLRNVRKKFIYYKKFLTNIDHVDIFGVSMNTINDSNLYFYKTLIKEHLINEK